ncbi:CDP-glucose 4,6-dehydratase [Desulfosporosinus fructosivorans]|uniref:CDP-glucose 4,6-dehydratase n=1 Tax=Desulfosporosinus fructosivorans TaxID=2018669 RepID=A0A4Z0QX80_9FIRM|nr:CDP-glucose 4,6-dehydratase [Desulfosporosinus fructosivorans]TGE35392.1 CDP-glucose 4,6-dehydratase [Desulfosporosinus fructosivorans]
MDIDRNFWQKKRIFLTGHTGFKGSWLSLWLSSLGAQVIGYALSPPTKPSMFEICKIEQITDSTLADIRDLGSLTQALQSAKADIVIHMAAQSLVRKSYLNPVETYSVNVLGTVNLLEAVRANPGIRAVLNITTDKCYENKEWVWGYRENDVLGGYDPYSSSKACSELITAAYRNSFFKPQEYATHKVALASARAGNVIGGGDWGQDRLIPDLIQALLTGEKFNLRNPQAIRPWQHVLEPLIGYLNLAQKLYTDGPAYTGAWNFGPDDTDAQPVEWVAKTLCSKWGKPAHYEIEQGSHPHETSVLTLNCAKAKQELHWSPRWNLDKALERVVEWYKAYQESQDLQALCFRQIAEYTNCKN